MLIRIRKLSSSRVAHARSAVASRAAYTRLTCFDRLLCVLYAYAWPAILRYLSLTKNPNKNGKSKKRLINNNKNVDSNLLRDSCIKIIVYIIRDMSALDKQIQSHSVSVTMDKWNTSTNEQKQIEKEMRCQTKQRDSQKHKKIIHFKIYTRTHAYL